MNATINANIKAPNDVKSTFSRVPVRFFKATTRSERKIGEAGIYFDRCGIAREASNQRSYTVLLVVEPADFPPEDSFEGEQTHTQGQGFSCSRECHRAEELGQSGEHVDTENTQREISCTRGLKFKIWICQEAVDDGID